MTNDFKLYVGVDWATEEHEVCALDANGKKVGARSFKHIGDGLADITTWLRAEADPNARSLRGRTVPVLRAACRLPGASVRTQSRRW